MDHDQAAVAELRRIATAAKELATALEAAIRNGLLSVPEIPPVSPSVDLGDEDWIEPCVAAGRAGKSDTTIRRYVYDVRYPGIGKKIGGRWKISSKVLRQVIAGELPLPSKRTNGR
ncbi:hypothetical protein [Mesorhizobium jarvisii]|uniref:hypothetical protein n=1 Tax=Mesorhizobium jarvisii TaxID=1777867 RepID=UPI001F0AFF56|nr:hypothetical protein [Mesorhizobium jarvisii]MCH4560350.1 hypothetical protein [Mesorhizobium jarvisii]